MEVDIFDYFDDFCLFFSLGVYLSGKIIRLSNNECKVGLKINCKKIKWISIGCKCNC